MVDYRHSVETAISLGLILEEDRELYAYGRRMMKLGLPPKWLELKDMFLNRYGFVPHDEFERVIRAYAKQRRDAVRAATNFDPFTSDPNCKSCRKKFDAS